LSHHDLFEIHISEPASTRQRNLSMPHDARKYLFDALSACDAIAEFTQRKSLDDYLDELILRSAVERQFEILGEAFSKLDSIAPDYRDQYTDMGKIIGMRNRIIHGYDSVDDTIIWDAIQNHLPTLHKWLKRLNL
jgi:uncharacterized protein with HEPN domain